MTNNPLRVGIGGPVGSGKTALTLALCKRLRDRYRLAVVTNDIYTEEDTSDLLVINKIDLAPMTRCLGEFSPAFIVMCDRWPINSSACDSPFVYSTTTFLLRLHSKQLKDVSVWVIKVDAASTAAMIDLHVVP